MLEGLDAVEWRGLAHAHGVATDVPEQLRTVAQADPGDAAWALYQLYGNLWNDGRVYPATVAAIPFLVELATADGVEAGRRVDLLVLLARIGAAGGGDAADRRRCAAELQRAAPAVGPLLETPSSSVTLAAAGLSAILAQPSRAWARRLRALAEAEPEPVARALFAVAGALAEGRQPSHADIDTAAAVDPYIDRWRSGRWEGLLGRRISRRQAVELALTLTELALERAP